MRDPNVRSKRPVRRVPPVVVEEVYEPPVKSRQSGEELKKTRAEEMRVYGEAACRAVFAHRPEAIVKASFNDNVAPRMADCMQYLAKNRRAYKIVDDAELTKIAASQHHGGVVMVVKKPPINDVEQYLRRNATLNSDCILMLDDVGNPHNVGAVMRSCAHFGVRAMLLRDPNIMMSGSAARVAEGGAESVEIIAARDMERSLRQLCDADYVLLTTSSHAGYSLFQTDLPGKVVLAFGEEVHGLSERIVNMSDGSLMIPGSGNVESLNVSVAASIVLAEWWRQWRVGR